MLHVLYKISHFFLYTALTDGFSFWKHTVFSVRYELNFKYNVDLSSS